MPGVAFGYPPDDPDGDWVAALPPGGVFGEVLVYAKATVVPIPPYVGKFVRYHQSAVTFGDPGSFYWSQPNVTDGGGPGASITTMDVRLLCRFDSADLVYLLQVDEGLATMLALWVTGTGTFHFQYPDSWTPYNLVTHTPPIPGGITPERWVWLRVALDFASTLSLQYSLDHLNPSPTDWTVFESTPSVAIPIRPSGLGDGHPSAIGGQHPAYLPATGALDMRRISWSFNGSTPILSTFETSPTVTVTTQTTITADSGVTADAYISHINLPVTVETE